MKRLLTTLSTLCLALAISLGNTTEEKTIKDLINKAYVEAIHNNGNLDDARLGFHNDFIMYMCRNGSISTLTIGDWIKRIEANRAKNASSNNAIKSYADFKSIDITGNVASVKLDLKKEDKVIYTDHFFLYKINDKWRIVSKVFYAH